MVGVISMFVSDAATIAMTIPIGMSVVRHTWTMARGAGAGNDEFRGVHHAGHVLRLGRRRHRDDHGRAAQRHRGVAARADHRTAARVLRVDAAPACRCSWPARRVLWPPVDARAAGDPRDARAAKHSCAPSARSSGPMRPNERRVLLVFAVMVTLFTLPTLAGLALGGGASGDVGGCNRALPVWVVPPAVMFLLFTIRSTGADRWRSADMEGCRAARAVEHDVPRRRRGGDDRRAHRVRLRRSGGRHGQGLGIGATALPYIAAAVVRHHDELHLGHAPRSTAPSSFRRPSQIGFNPASMAILIAQRRRRPDLPVGRRHGGDGVCRRRHRDGPDDPHRYRRDRVVHRSSSRPST